MRFEWDEKKNSANRAKHGIGFNAVADFDWPEAIIINRSRHSDGEQRMAAIGYLFGKLYTVIHVWRGHQCRIISLRRSNRQEEVFYVQKKTH